MRNAATKHTDPFGHLPRHAVLIPNPFEGKLRKFVNNTLDDKSDEESLLTIVSSYVEQRRKQAEKGVIDQDQALRDIRRAVKLYDSIYPDAQNKR